MQRIAVLLALVLGSQGCFSHAHQTRPITNRELANGLIWTGVVVSGLVLGGLAVSGNLDSTTHREPPPPTTSPMPGQPW
ncbi:MAG TPA: hypothetical protein VFQ53_37830 [Kofleriaceae bacterium]|nr:hypothetical protein [Kofleriaceae bacterium]